jgi:hypothetical protein
MAPVNRPEAGRAGEPDHNEQQGEEQHGARSRRRPLPT